MPTLTPVTQGPIAANSAASAMASASNAATSAANAASIIGAVPPVNTISSLRTILITTNNVIYYVKAHTASGDGGGGNFRSVTGAAVGTYVDNNGTIIVPAGGDGSAAWLRELTSTTDVKWFGAVGDGLTDDSAAVQAFFDSLSLSSSCGTLPKLTYFCTKTINIPANITIMSNSAMLKFSVTGAYTTIVDRANVASGNFTLVDTKAARDFTVLGQLGISTDGVYSEDPLVHTIPDTLVAMTSSAAGTPTGEFNIDKLLLLHCGYGFYVANQDPFLTGAGAQNMPYTRSNIGFLDIQQCSKGIVTEDVTRNAFDDTWIDTLRVHRSRDINVSLAGSELSIGAAFINGLITPEIELASGIVATPNLTLSTAGTWANGDYICIDKGLTITPNVSLVTTIVSGAGTTNLVLADNLERTVANVAVYRPTATGIILGSATNAAGAVLNCQHLFIEHVFKDAILLRENACLNVDDFKITSGIFGSRKGAAIITDYIEGSVNVKMNPKRVSTGFGIAMVVYLGMVSKAGVLAKRSINISIPANAAYKAVTYGPPVTLAGGYTDESAVELFDNIVISSPSGLISCRGFNGNAESASSGELHIPSIRQAASDSGTAILAAGVVQTIVKAADINPDSTMLLSCSNATGTEIKLYHICATSASVLIVRPIDILGADVVLNTGANRLRLTSSLGTTVKWSLTYLQRVL